MTCLILCPLSSDNAKSCSLCGTPNYIAPEVLSKLGHTPATEVWSVGCMAYALLCGAPPFETDSVNATYSRIRAGSFTLPHAISLEAASFIGATLAHQPLHRATISSLFSHTFLAGPTPPSLPPSALTTPPPLPRDTSMTPSDFLQHVIEELETSLQPHMSRLREFSTMTIKPTLVTKWVDFSNKYGFGYTLSNCSVGVLLRDGSRILSNQEIVQFTHRLGEAIIMPKATLEEVKEETVASAMQVLAIISTYMEENLASCLVTEEEEDESLGQLVAWYRRKGSVTMQFAGQQLQVNFLSSHVKVVVWTRCSELLLSVFCHGSMETIPVSRYLPEHFRERVAAVLQELEAFRICKTD